MNAHFAANGIGHDRGDDTLHEFRLRGSDRVREGDGCDPETADELRGVRNFLFAPGIPVRVPERHRNVGDHLQASFSRARVDSLQRRSIFLQRLILVPAQERLRNRIRKAKCVHRPGRDRALRAFLVHDDADNFDALGPA